VRLTYRVEDGVRLGVLLWTFGPGWRMISSAMLGGGIGVREWVLNAQVPGGYARMDPVDHLLELAPPGPGVGMLTAASVRRFTEAEDGGVRAWATVGLRVPTWAASPEGVPDPELAPIHVPPPPGTINIVVAVPAAVTDAALVNLVMTITEAKAQALAETGFSGTGTASDAVCVATRIAPAPGPAPGTGPGTGSGPASGPASGSGTGSDRDPFGGPRSYWGSRAARAVHTCVRSGAVGWRDAR
jgi:adenosylcobinamide amidohydrolase